MNFPKTASRWADFVFLCLLVALTAQGGSAECAEWIEIRTLQDLANIENDLSANYLLVNDIDVSGIIGLQFAPIGSVQRPFTGNIEGQGFRIIGLRVWRPNDDHVGIFAVLEGRVARLGIEDIHVEGREYVGGVAGINKGAIQNTYVVGRVIGEGDNVGGLAGLSSGSIMHSYTEGRVTGRNRVGGLAGGNLKPDFSISITNSYSSAAVSGKQLVGGLVGENHGKITICFASGKIEGERNVGGLVGSNEGHVLRTFASGDVDGDRQVGGLVGMNYTDAQLLEASIANYSKIEESFAMGRVNGKDHIGGLVGDNHNGMVSDCAYVGPLVSGNDKVGGLVGDNLSTMSFVYYSFSYGRVTSPRSNDKGGLIGRYDFGLWVPIAGVKRVVGSYWDKEASHCGTCKAAEGKTTAQMKRRSTYTGWDFEDIWDIDEDRGTYPFLRWRFSINPFPDPPQESSQETPDVWSDFVLIPPWGDLPLIVIPPVPPQNAQAEAHDRRIVLTWTPTTSQHAKAYRIYVRSQHPLDVEIGKPKPFLHLVTVPVSQARFEHAGLTNGRQYVYTIRSVDAWGHASTNSSNTASAIPGLGFAEIGEVVAGLELPGPLSDVPEIQIIRPLPPGNIAATPGDRKVTVSWDASTSPFISGYNLYVRTEHSSIPGIDDADTFLLLASLATDQAAYEHQALVNGVRYFYAAKSVNAFGYESVSFSRAVSAIPDHAAGVVLDNAAGVFSDPVNRGYVHGGSIEGTVENQGLLSGKAPAGAAGGDYTMVVEPGAIVTGGEMDGTIVNMGTLLDVTFRPGASVRFVHWSSGEPGRFAGTVAFMGKAGRLSGILDIPAGTVFPDPQSIPDEGLVIHARDFLDYAVEAGWMDSAKTFSVSSCGKSLLPIPENLIPVGGLVLSEKGARSVNRFDVIIPYDIKNLPEGSSPGDIEVLAYDCESGWITVTPEEVDDGAIRIRTSLITAYALVVEGNGGGDGTDQQPASKSGDKSGFDTCFVGILLP